MSYCPRCGIAGGGSDRNGRTLPNHFCRHDQFDTPAGYAELNAEQIERARKFDEECRQIVERGRAEMAAAEEKEVERQVAEEQRQQRMRDEHRRLMEQRRRDAELEEITHKLTYGGRC